MTIGPEDIEGAVFKERFRGYDPDQVDRFLDQVAGGLAALRAERDELAAQVEVLRGTAGFTAAPAAGGEGVDALIKRTLGAAQRTAGELVADARRQAGELVSDASRRVARDQEQVRAEAELVRRAVAELRAFRDEYRGRLHAIMSEQLAALDRAGELPRLPAVVERLGESPAAPRDAVAAIDAPSGPSPARAWAAAAAEEPEDAPEPVTDGDDLASPWDDLWRGGARRAGAPDVQDGPETGTPLAEGDFAEVPHRDTGSTDLAGDA